MKTETYDRTIDGFVELSIILGYIILGFIIALIGLYAIYTVAMLGNEVFGLIIPLPEIWIMMVTATPTSIIFSIICRGYRKAKKEYSIEKYRDFWMAWSHEVQWPLGRCSSITDDEKRDEILKWMDQNKIGLFREVVLDYRKYFVFYRSSDAAAFKLRWYE